MAKLPADLQPFVPSDAEPFDRTKAHHLLARAGFGATPEQLETVLSLGPRRAVDWLLDFPALPADEQSQSDVPDLSGIEGYPRNFAERRKLFEGLTPDERQELNQKLMGANREALFATAAWWLNRMHSGPYPLQEKLTLFWHGHFTTSARDERSAWLMWQQQETLRTHAAGNFRAFVKAISRDPAMLDYLNNQQNRKGSPNENYARELMELFTLGVGRYTEQDIKEAARAFTGWHHDGEEFVFRRTQHDTGPKTFFGRTGTFGGDEIIDLILARPECGAYVASRLWNFFVYENLEPDFANALGALLRENDYELRPLLRAMLMSRRFYSSQAIGTQIKSPVQLVIGTARALDVPVPPRRKLNQPLEAMGQVPMMPPNVKGWPGGRSWINSSTLFVRVNTALMLLQDVPEPALVPESVRNDPVALVDYWLDRLIGRPIDEGKRALLVADVGSNANVASARKLLELIVSMPDYQLC